LRKKRYERKERKMKMKKVFAVVLAGAMAASLAACGSSSSSDSSAASGSAGSGDSSASGVATAASTGDLASADADLDYTAYDLSGKTIGYVTINSSAPWGGRIGTEFAKYAEEVGAKVNSLDAQTDADKVTEYAQQCIDQGVDALVIFGGDINANVDIAKSAQEAGIPVFMAALDVADGGQQYVAAVVGPDQKQMCADIAEYVVEQNGTDTDYTVAQISGVPFLEDYIQREAGFQGYMADYSNYTLLESQYAYSSRDDAKGFMQDILNSNPETNIVMGYDDDLTMGAVQAIDEAGKTGEIKVYSLTGQKDAIQAVIDGKMELTVMNRADNIAKGLVSTIGEYYNNDGTLSAYYYRTPLTYITSENAADYLDQAEF
jgi:ABC-type sugar transport system substrate-binding protein